MKPNHCRPRIALVALLCAQGWAAEPVDFVRDVQPIFARHCVSCHGPEKQKSEYRLDVKRTALAGGESGHKPIVPGKSAASPLINFVSGADPDTKMPPKGEPLSAKDVATLRAWIDQGATWPDGAGVKLADRREWWSLQPLTRSAVPGTNVHPIDAFIRARLTEKKLAPALVADRRTLIRRVNFDLIGLPPSPEEADAFVADPDPRAYEKLVDRLLASPRHGERWARHWLDVVHYGETHGYDKDQPRLNAWPYRDYVIRAFNDYKPYARFVQEQIAGDALFPGTSDGIEALGFIAAGPWDMIGHAEVPETKIDGKIARHLDRDDMVANTINTFNSVTIHCAQCHNHKFDPLPQEDYYALQAVFSALDRADRKYDRDPAVAQQRTQLEARKLELTQRQTALTARATSAAGPQLADLDKRLASAEKSSASKMRPEFGYHSGIDPKQDATKWVQVDLGTNVALEKVVLAPCHDDFNKIGAGFGFPVRFKIEAGEDAEFRGAVTMLADQTLTDFANPGIAPQTFSLPRKTARFLRVTATWLAPRQNDFIFALAELQAFDAAGVNRAAGKTVTAFDTIEAAPRWQRSNLTDGIYPAAASDQAAQLTALRQQRAALLEQVLDADSRKELAGTESALAKVNAELTKLPAASVVYAGTIHSGSGNFTGTGAKGGQSRPIFLLARGDVKKPGASVGPGALSCIEGWPARFVVATNAPEGERRAALARWLTEARHPLTWRSIVNRVWQYHFGRALADSPNDFGRMGQLPSHPELLDWLAVTFRDDYGGSFKQLHRLIVTSAAYRQRSDVRNADAEQFDADNRLLWRMNRRKLEAEAVRDTVLSVAGKLDLPMGGPSFQDFVITHPEHSPHYEYQLADPANPALHRRSVYRFIVRSQQQPWMAALDCADPSMLVDKRNQTLTPLQALAQLNNQLMVVMAKDFAGRVTKESGADVGKEITRAFRLAVQREPSPEELRALVAYAGQHGLPNTCRVIINLNEFAFID